MAIVSKHNEPAESPEVITITKVKTVAKTHVQPDEEAQVIVHCSLKTEAGSGDTLIRIWQTTFLVDKTTHTKSKLLHAENISVYPQWTLVQGGGTANFTLYFSPLPKSCKVFDLIEEIPENGGFEKHGIARNKADVYHVRLA